MLGAKEMHLSGTFQNQGNALLDHADTSSKDEEQSSSFGRATAEGAVEGASPRERRIGALHRGSAASLWCAHLSPSIATEMSCLVNINTMNRSAISNAHAQRGPTSKAASQQGGT